MTNKDETSRHRLLDAIECIKNCEAIVSHCNEIMDSYYDKYMEVWDGGEKSYVVTKKYESCDKMKAMATKIRRRMMKKIFDRFEDADHDYRCILKHAASVKQFADEVDDAEASGIFREDTASSYKLMSLALSLFVWEEPQLCARCMLDDMMWEDDDIPDDVNEKVINLLDKDLMFNFKWVLEDKRDLRNQHEVFIWDLFIVTHDWDKEINEIFVWTGERWFKHPEEITEEMMEDIRLADKKERYEGGNI